MPPPPSLKVHNITDKNFTFQWEKPAYLPGNLTRFEIIFSWNYKFHQPEWCKGIDDSNENRTIIDGKKFSLSFNNGRPYSQYKVQIKAMTGAGWGNYSDDAWFITLPGGNYY